MLGDSRHPRPPRRGDTAPCFPEAPLLPGTSWNRIRSHTFADRAALKPIACRTWWTNASLRNREPSANPLVHSCCPIRNVARHVSRALVFLLDPNRRAFMRLGIEAIFALGLL